MNARKFFYLMIGVVIALVISSIAVLGWANKSLSKRSQQLVSLKLNNRVLDEQQLSLAQAKKDITKYSDLNSIARSVVPQDKDQAEAVREIVKIASDSNVKLSAISFPASTLGQATKAPSSSSSDTATPKTTKPSITQVKPVDSIPGVFVMEINIHQDSNTPVSYNSLIDFLNRLEQNRRTAQVISVTVQPNALNRSLLTFSLIVNIYIKP